MPIASAQLNGIGRRAISQQYEPQIPKYMYFTRENCSYVGMAKGDSQTKVISTSANFDGVYPPGLSIAPYTSGSGYTSKGDYYKNGTTEIIINVSDMAPFIQIWRSTDSGTTWTLLTTPSTVSTTVYQASIDPSGTYIAISATTPLIWKLTGNSLSALSLPNWTAIGTIYSVEWDRTGTAVAFGGNAGTRISIYTRSGDTFTKGSYSGTALAGTVRQMMFNPTKDALIIRQSSSPYTYVMTLSGGTLTMDAGFNTVKTTIGGNFAFWSVDGNYAYYWGTTIILYRNSYISGVWGATATQNMPISGSSYAALNLTNNSVYILTPRSNDGASIYAYTFVNGVLNNPSMALSSNKSAHSVLRLSGGRLYAGGGSNYNSGYNLYDINNSTLALTQLTSEAKTHFLSSSHSPTALVGGDSAWMSYDPINSVLAITGSSISLAALKLSNNGDVLTIDNISPSALGLSTVQAYGACWHPAGSYLVCGSYASTYLKLLYRDSSGNWSNMAVNVDIPARMSSATWSPDGNYVIVGTITGGSYVYSFHPVNGLTQVSSGMFNTGGISIKHIKYHPSGSYVIVITSQFTSYIYSTTNNYSFTLESTFNQEYYSSEYSIQWNSTGSHLFTVAGSYLFVYSFSNAQLSLVYYHQQSVLKNACGLRLTPDDSTLYIFNGNTNDSILVYKVNNDKSLTLLNGTEVFVPYPGGEGNYETTGVNCVIYDPSYPNSYYMR